MLYSKHGCLKVMLAGIRLLVVEEANLDTGFR